MMNRFWERLWKLKFNLEDGIEQSLEAVGLIDGGVRETETSVWCR